MPGKRSLVAAFALALLVITSARPALAQPVDYAKAKELYKNAEDAMTAGNYDDAVTGYQGAYDITHDATLFYKIASAYDKGGKCQAALPLYGRYLKEGKPKADFAKLTKDRIKVCETIVKNQPKVDTAKAKELYTQAEAAMAAGQFDVAITDYQGAYDLMKDPTLFFKLGTAYEKAGKCADAITTYNRYIAEAKPKPEFVFMTNTHIDECKKTIAAEEKAKADAEAAAKQAEIDRLAAEKAAADKAAADKAAAEQRARDQALAEQHAREQAARDRQAHHSAGHRRLYGYITLGAGVGFATVGTLYALTLSGTEDDIDQLQSAEVPPAYEGAVKDRYDELESEGKRNMYLAWTGFGLAAVSFGVGSYLIFTAKDHAVEVAPMIGGGTTGASASLKF